MIALAAVIWACVACLVWWDVLPLLTRLVAVHERRYPVPDLIPAALAPEPLPPDLESLAMGESEEWARDNVRERAWELFRMTKNWDEAKRILHAERMLTLLGGEPSRGVS